MHHAQEGHQRHGEEQQVERLATAAQPDEQGEQPGHEERSAADVGQLRLEEVAHPPGAAELVVVAHPQARQRAADAADVLHADQQIARARAARGASNAIHSGMFDPFHWRLACD